MKMNIDIEMNVNTFFFLTLIGAHPVEDPYVFFGKKLAVLYFIYYFLSVFILKA